MWSHGEPASQHRCSNPMLCDRFKTALSSSPWGATHHPTLMWDLWCYASVSKRITENFLGILSYFWARLADVWAKLLLITSPPGKCSGCAGSLWAHTPLVSRSQNWGTPVLVSLPFHPDNLLVQGRVARRTLGRGAAHPPLETKWLRGFRLLKIWGEGISVFEPDTKPDEHFFNLANSQSIFMMQRSKIAWEGKEGN